MVAAGLALIAASRLLIASSGGLDNAPAKRKRPDAGKRKAAKRASKASKRAIMYREFGSRPWVDAHPADALRLPRSYWSRAIGHEAIMRELRKDSGFKQMSTIANYYRTHAVTDVLNCGHCDGRGTWKDEEKGPTMCLRCKGKGRVIFCKPQWIKYVPSADRYEREMRLREQVAGLYMDEAERPE